MPTLATASASVRTVKNVRALRRVKSVTDLRTMADMSASSRRDDAVANGDRPVRLPGELAVVGHVEDRRALGIEPLQQVEHLRRGTRVEIAGRLVTDQQRRVGGQC